MRLRDIFLATSVAFAWGSYFAVSKIILSSFPPLLFGALRFFLVFLFTFPFFFKDRIPLKKVACFSLVLFLNLVALNQAISYSSSLAPIILLNELVVPISMFFGAYFFKEKVTSKDILGVIIALIGLAIVVHLKSAEQINLAAVVLGIIATFLFACYNLMVKSLASVNILALFSQYSLLLFLMFLLASFYQEDWPSITQISHESIIALLYSVIVCTLLSYFIWFYLLNKYPLGKIVPFTLLSPVFGCIIVAIFLKEHIEMSTILGGALVILGLTIIELKNYAIKKP